MREAAASVSRITWGRGLRGLADGVGVAGVMSVIWSVPAANQCRSFEPKSHPLTLHHMLSTRRASSLIRSGDHAGSQTRLILTTPTPGTLQTAFSTWVGSSPAAGQFGVVR